MDTEPVGDYCHEIEAYLCRKNDGHLVRVVGPSFDLVSGWAAQGIPLKVAFRGIDRYFERYYRKGPRRRPVRIDFCEADVLDVFDEWRRALGIPSESPIPNPESPESRVPNPESRRASLPAHLERVVMRLSSARATGALGEGCDEVIDRVARELDAARAAAGGVRGDARRALLARLAELDADLLRAARASLDEAARGAIARDAEGELAGFRAGMTPDVYVRTLDQAIDRLTRERLRLPIVSFA